MKKSIERLLKKLDAAVLKVFEPQQAAAMIHEGNFEGPFTDYALEHLMEQGTAQEELDRFQHQLKRTEAAGLVYPEQWEQVLDAWSQRTELSIQQHINQLRDSLLYIVRWTGREGQRRVPVRSWNDAKKLAQQMGWSSPDVGAARVYDASEKVVLWEI